MPDAILFVLLVGMQVSLMQFYSDKEVQTGALTNIISKVHDKDAYYFVIEGSYFKEKVTLACNKETFDKLIVDKDVLYTFSYRSAKYFDKVYGVLESIDADDVIDNRRATSSDSSAGQTS